MTVNWYTNQNNFFRQVRNFVIDLTGLPATTGTGIHWQVAQVLDPVYIQGTESDFCRLQVSKTFDLK